MTNGDFGINEAPSVRSDRAIVEEILHVDTDDSVNNDGGVNEGNQLSPDEKLFIDVLVRSESESLEDRPHVQTSSNEVLFPDLTAEEIGFTEALEKTTTVVMWKELNRFISMLRLATMRG